MQLYISLRSSCLMFQCHVSTGTIAFHLGMSRLHLRKNCCFHKTLFILTLLDCHVFEVPEL